MFTENHISLNKVTVKVPATTANLGPGLDCIAMALDMYNTTTFEKSKNFELIVEGEGEHELSLEKDNLIYLAFETFYKYIEEPWPCVRISCKNNIPVSRGLGSSAAAIISGLLAANAWSSKNLSEIQILNIANQLEGHADNITAALKGGCVVVLSQRDSIYYCSVPFPPEIKVVTFIPDFRMNTRVARKLLEESPFSLQDVLFNMERVAMLVLSLTTNHLEDLRIATQDRLHQPRRQKIFPQMSSIFDAALAGGALGVFLSGGGSSIIGLAKHNELKVGQAMAEKGAEVGVTGRIVVLHPSFQGAQVMWSA